MSATTGRIGRQPVYRRPSWAQKEGSYKHYMRRDLAEARSPGSDHGLDSFSYDEDHLEKWQIPSELRERLPEALKHQVAEWECAGAAVCTSLERIRKLEEESLYRGYPEKSSRLASLSRQGSSASPAMPGAETPPMGSPMSPTPAMSSSLLPLEKMSFDTLPQRRHIVCTDSPPMTPIDSHTCPTPDFPNIDKGMPPDAGFLIRQLSPVSMRSRAESISARSRAESTSTRADSTTSTGTVFDENAWEFFITTFKAELDDLRQVAWTRFKGSGYTIDKLRVELAYDKANKGLVEDFNKWWAETKPQVAEYETKVRQLEVPSLELVCMERQAYGLTV